MLMAVVTLVCALVLRDILRIFDDRFMAPHLQHPDREFVSRMYKERRRLSLFQVLASVLFVAPFIYLHLQNKHFLRFSSDKGQLNYVWKETLFTAFLFVIGAAFTALFFRVLKPRI